LSNNKFKRVSQLFGTYLLLEDNTSLNRDGSRYFGIWNYRLQYQSNDWVCPSCKGTGGTVSEKKVNIVSGYNNNINYGSQTATIVSTPVYTQIGGMNVKTPCDACKGVGIKKIELTRVQVLD
jgi:excinuclease UvrABC ATPase subunit